MLRGPAGCSQDGEVTWSGFTWPRVHRDPARGVSQVVLQAHIVKRVCSKGIAAREGIKVGYPGVHVLCCAYAAKPIALNAGTAHHP